MVSLKKAKRLVEHDWLNMPNVVGVCTGPKCAGGIVTDRQAVVVLVARKVPLTELHGSEAIPAEANGIPTDVVVADLPPLGHTDKRRPYMTGDQIGVDGQAATGTLGMVYRIGGQDYGMTCWHVVAQASNISPLGLNITQPGNAGSYERDEHGDLGPNLLIQGQVTHVASPFATDVDAVAFTLPEGPGPKLPDVGWNAPGPQWDRSMDLMQRCPENRYFYGFPHHHKTYDACLRGVKGERDQWPAGVKSAVVGSTVTAYGARSGPKRMKVFADDLTAYMRYPGGRTVMENLIALSGTGTIVRRGDSGGVIVDQADRHVVGMIFAGKGDFTVACPIKPTLIALHGDAMGGLIVGD